MVLKGCLGRLFFGPCMHIVVAEEPGILLTNSPGWDFMSEIGLARAGSNEVSRQHNKSNAWFYCFYQKCYFLDLSHWLIDSWLMTHDSLTHLTHKTSVLVPRGSSAHDWKLSSRLFSRPHWMPLGLRGCTCICGFLLFWTISLSPHGRFQMPYCTLCSRLFPNIDACINKGDWRFQL